MTTGPLRSFHRTEFRDADPESGRVTAVISTGDLARDGAVIEAGGWDFTAYRRNPVVLWGHNDSSFPVGRTVDIRVENDRVVADAQMDVEDPEAMRLLRKIRGGFVSATSVRWNPLQTEVRQTTVDGKKRDVLAFLRQELLEWSFVGVPADAGALIVRAATGVPVTISEYAAPETASLIAQLAERLASGRPDDLDRNALDGLHRQLAELLDVQVGEPDIEADVLLALSATLSEATAMLRRPPPRVDVSGVLVDVLARATGRSPEDIRKLVEAT